MGIDGEMTAGNEDIGTIGMKQNKVQCVDQLVQLIEKNTEEEQWTETLKIIDHKCTVELDTGVCEKLENAGSERDGRFHVKIQLQASDIFWPPDGAKRQNGA